MKRIIFVSLAFCLLIGPAFSLPAENRSEKLEDFGEGPTIKNPNENEVNGTVNRDTEKVGSSESEPESEIEAFGGFDENLLSSMSSINGQIKGFVQRSGSKGELHCRNVTCPNGTVKCEFDSTQPGNDRTVEVHYKCLDKTGKLLEEKKQTESSEQVRVPSYVSKMFEQFDNFWKQLSSMFDKDDDADV